MAHLTETYALFAYALRQWRFPVKISPSSCYDLPLSGKVLKLLDLSFRNTQGVLPFPLNPRQMNEVTRYKSTQLLGSCSWESRSHCKDPLKIGNAANPSTAKKQSYSAPLEQTKAQVILNQQISTEKSKSAQAVLMRASSSRNKNK